MLRGSPGPMQEIIIPSSSADLLSGSFIIVRISASVKVEASRVSVFSARIVPLVDESTREFDRRSGPNGFIRFEADFEGQILFHLGFGEGGLCPPGKRTQQQCESGSNVSVAFSVHASEYRRFIPGTVQSGSRLSMPFRNGCTLLESLNRFIASIKQEAKIGD